VRRPGRGICCYFLHVYWALIFAFFFDKQNAKRKRNTLGKLTCIYKEAVFDANSGVVGFYVVSMSDLPRALPP
jgi:hypothetical protein